MPSRTAKPIVGQELLFSGDFYNAPDSMTWRERENEPILAAYRDASAEGVPKVDLLDRANRLIEALTEMGRMSSVGAGFLTAVHTSHVERIDEHYGRFVTPVVERNAKNKLPRREQRVRSLLAPIVGYDALRLAQPQLMPREEIDARAKHTWETFESMFKGPKNQERRDEYRRQLRKQRTQQKRLRRKLGLDNQQQIA